MLLPLVALLAALGPALAQVQSPPLNLTVYYEALCPDSERFVVDQLAPLWRSVGGGVLAPTFVPWGKAWEHATSTDAFVTCQHGSEECWGNRLHGCVLSELPAAGDQLEAVTCLLAGYRSLRRSAPGCVRAAGLDWRRVSQCAASAASLQQALQFGRQTNALNPQLTFVPTMTVDGSQSCQRLLLANLQYFVCETWRQRAGLAATGCPSFYQG